MAAVPVAKKLSKSAAQAHVKRQRKDTGDQSWLVECEPLPLPSLERLIGRLPLHDEPKPVNELGYAQVVQYLKNYNLPAPLLTGDFDWRWKDERGAALTKRLATWAKAVHNKTPPDYVWASLGQFCDNLLCKEPKTYHTAVYPGPFCWGLGNWGEGEKARPKFGMGSSCWWNDKSGKGMYSVDGHSQSEWFYMRGGYALLLYDDPLCLCSDIGRCWIFEPAPGVYCLANGFIGSQMKTPLYARLVANHFGVSWQQTQVNQDSPPRTGTLRIGLYNGAAVVGPIELIDKFTTIRYGYASEDFSARQLPDPKIEARRREELIAAGRRYPESTPWGKKKNP